MPAQDDRFAWRVVKCAAECGWEGRHRLTPSRRKTKRSENVGCPKCGGTVDISPRYHRELPADPAMAEIFRKRLAVPIAKKLGIANQCIWAWKQVPLSRVFQVARITGMAPEKLRPDFFRGVQVRLLPLDSPLTPP